MFSGINAQLLLSMSCAFDLLDNLLDNVLDSPSRLLLQSAGLQDSGTSHIYYQIPETVFLTTRVFDAVTAEDLDNAGRE